MTRKLLSYLPLGQRAPMRGATTAQVQNSAGGYAWAVDDWTRLERFLILGSESGSYYASPQALTQENASVVLRCLRSDGLRTVRVVMDVSTGGRAAKKDATLLALAMCLKLGDLSTRKAAADAVLSICRTGTMLMQLATAVKALGGWGRVTRRAFGRWYQRESVEDLAYQVSKYRQREGWSHRDLLRLIHPTPPSETHDALYAWICNGAQSEQLPARIVAADTAQRAKTAHIVRLIRSHGLVREELPTHALTEPTVWSALLDSGRGMPMTALIRNLGRMTALGVIGKGAKRTHAVCEQLTDQARLRRARVHPLQVLVALNAYREGKGLRGQLTWQPSKQVIKALERCFSKSFGMVKSAGGRWMLAVDVSGSMGWSQISGMTGITPRIGAAAMAMATVRAEDQVRVTAFSSTLQTVDVPKTASLSSVLDTFDRIPMGGTDCALPMITARKQRWAVDTFVVYTDSETWHGKVHPVEALRAYRKTMNIPARLIVVGMVANRFTIADPDDSGMLDIVGFDTQAPRLMAQFASGQLG